MQTHTSVSLGVKKNGVRCKSGLLVVSLGVKGSGLGVNQACKHTLTLQKKLTSQWAGEDVYTIEEGSGLHTRSG